MPHCLARPPLSAYSARAGGIHSLHRRDCLGMVEWLPVATRPPLEDLRCDEISPRHSLLARCRCQVGAGLRLKVLFVGAQAPRTPP